MATNPRGLPPIPPGWELEGASSEMPPIPAGWVLEPAGSGRVVDGDTFPLADGRNARLSGVDAFELKQDGQDLAGNPVPLGRQAMNYLRGLVRPSSVVKATGAETYGRPVVTVSNDDQDAGRQLVIDGVAIPVPEYLASDPKRFQEYVAAQREAIAAERGAYAGTYQNPSDFRHQGAAAPKRGKIQMTSQQRTEYVRLLRNPKTTPAELSAWFSDQGHAVTNVDNILSFARRNPQAKISSYFQQQDVTGDPVLRDGPDAVTRTLAAFNEGMIAKGLGTPVDLVNGAMGAVGLPTSDKPIGGSAWISDRMHDLGFGQVDEGYAPRSDAERYVQSVADMAGQAVLPVGGTMAAGARLALPAARAAAGEAGAVRQALRAAAVEAAENPGVALAGEAGAAVASGVAGQAARDNAPDSPWAEAAATLIAGVGGGLAAGSAATRRGARAAALPDTSRARPQDIQVEEAPGLRVDAPAGEANGPAPTDVQAANPLEAPAVAQAKAEAQQLPPVTPTRAVATLGEARDAALDFVGTPIRNEETGVEATVSGNTLRKMTSQSAHARSTSAADHALAVANVDDLFRRAKLVERHADAAGSPTVDAISRWHAPLETADGTRMARITVKETKHPDSPNPLYTVQTLEVEPARIAPSNGIEQVPGQSRETSQAGSSADISEGPGLSNEPPIGRARPMAERASAEGMAQLAEQVQPGDVTPRPRSTVETLEEAERASPSTVRELQPRNPRDELQPYRLGNANRREPADLVTWLRSQGGVQDQGGNLRSMGITNAARPFDKGEGFVGRLVNPEGMTLDEATERAMSAGFFNERPTINELLDAIDETHRGTNRLYRPDDVDTVSRYEEAKAEREAIDRARDEGVPWSEEIGEPATLADRDANSAPAVAYEDLPAVAGKVGNIDVSKLETRGDIVRAVLNVHKKVGGFDAARRGRISHAETEALARELNLTSDDLLKRRPGQALNAEQALAARAILAKSSDELVSLAKAAQASEGAEADLSRFRQAWVRHVAIQEQVAGLTAEAGRTLSQFRAMASAKLPIGRVHKLLIEEAGGPDAVLNAAQAILDASGKPGAVNQTARLALKPKLKDKLVELYYNSLLSGPQTHAVNILSNTLTSLAQLPEHATAAALGQLRRRSDDRVLASELGGRAVGLLQGAQEGLWQAARTLRTGEGSDLLSKVEAQTTDAISGVKGKVIRTPTRMLSAEDELFKAMARKMEIGGLAVRKARAEGLKGDALKARIAELSASPSDAMVERAFDYGRYVTFQRPLGSLGQGISSIVQKHPALKLIVPFIRTPTNILKFAIERSPAAPFLKEWRDDVAAGGARRDLALSRVMLGSGLGALAVTWAEQGRITGSGPADDKARRLLEADGWQPYSVRIGNKYYSYQRLDPLSTTIGLAADMVDLRSHMTDSQREQAATLVGASIAQNLSSKTWLSGVADLTAAMADPSRHLDSWLSRMAGSIIVPAAVAQTARTLDPFVREVRGPMDRIRSRIPGLSQGLEPRRDVFGRPVLSEGGLGPDMATPIWERTARNDPTVRALLAADVGITPPSRKIGKRELTAAEYGRYSEQVGKLAKPQLDALVADRAWSSMSHEDRDKAVDGIMRRSRAEARGALGLLETEALPPIPAGFELEAAR